MVGPHDSEAGGSGGTDATPPGRADVPAAYRELTETTYQHLRAIAGKQMAGERAGHTLQPTALVSEAVIRLQSAGAIEGPSDPRFFWAAAEAMRRILIDHARARNTIKRGGGRPGVGGARIDWTGAIRSAADLAEHAEIEDMEALDGAISRLEEEDPRSAQVVRLRFFAGLSFEQVADMMGVSVRTAKRDWEFGRVVLLRSLDPAADA